MVGDHPTIVLHKFRATFALVRRGSTGIDRIDPTAECGDVGSFHIDVHVTTIVPTLPNRFADRRGKGDGVIEVVVVER